MNEDGKIDYAEVMRRLPHRYPFLLVDKAEDFVPRTSIVGIKNVSHNEPFFPGHFPIDPVMPGVLIVEAMAQTGALLMSKTLDVAVADKVIMFMSIDGTWTKIMFHLAALNKPPISVSKLIEERYRVVLDEDNSYIIHKKINMIINMRKARGVFVVDAHMANKPGQVFERQR